MRENIILKCTECGEENYLSLIHIFDMYYIEAMAYANENNQNMCPVLGIVDDSISHLKVHYVDKSKHYYKGVQLSGQTTQVQSVKLYISYYLDEDKTERVEKYIEVEP